MLCFVYFKLLLSWYECLKYLLKLYCLLLVTVLILNTLNYQNKMLYVVYILTIK